MHVKEPDWRGFSRSRFSTMGLSRTRKVGTGPASRGMARSGAAWLRGRGEARSGEEWLGQAWSGFADVAGFGTTWPGGAGLRGCGSFRQGTLWPGRDWHERKGGASRMRLVQARFVSARRGSAGFGVADTVWWRRQGLEGTASASRKRLGWVGEGTLWLGWPGQAGLRGQGAAGFGLSRKAWQGFAAKERPGSAGQGASRHAVVRSRGTGGARTGRLGLGRHGGASRTRHGTVRQGRQGQEGRGVAALARWGGAGRGRARHGAGLARAGFAAAEGRGVLWPGTIRPAWSGYSDVVGTARCGSTRLGREGFGFAVAAWRGRDRRGPGAAGLRGSGVAGTGGAWRGSASRTRRGGLWLGAAGQGPVWHCFAVLAGFGSARQGPVCPGRADRAWLVRSALAGRGLAAPAWRFESWLWQGAAGRGSTWLRGRGGVWRDRRGLAGFGMASRSR
jgi:hypothetical protein